MSDAVPQALARLEKKIDAILARLDFEPETLETEDLTPREAKQHLAQKEEGWLQSQYKPTDQYTPRTRFPDLTEEVMKAMQATGRGYYVKEPWLYWFSKDQRFLCRRRLTGKKRRTR